MCTGESFHSRTSERERNSQTEMRRLQRNLLALRTRVFRVLAEIMFCLQGAFSCRSASSAASRVSSNYRLLTTEDVWKEQKIELNRRKSPHAQVKCVYSVAVII